MSPRRASDEEKERKKGWGEGRAGGREGEGRTRARMHERPPHAHGARAHLSSSQRANLVIVSGCKPDIFGPAVVVFDKQVSCEPQHSKGCLSEGRVREVTEQVPTFTLLMLSLGFTKIGDFRAS